MAKNEPLSDINQLQIGHLYYDLRDDQVDPMLNYLEGMSAEELEEANPEADWQDHLFLKTASPEEVEDQGPSTIVALSIEPKRNRNIKDFLIRWVYADYFDKGGWHFDTEIYENYWSEFQGRLLYANKVVPKRELPK